jgi:hypothetical protein
MTNYQFKIGRIGQNKNKTRGKEGKIMEQNLAGVVELLGELIQVCFGFFIETIQRLCERATVMV